MSIFSANDIIKFWFNDIDTSKWFIKDSDFDSLLIDKYSLLHQSAHKGELYSWRSTPQGRLAEIVILDQFSRNIYRDDLQSFSSDGIALVLAQTAIANGDDMALTAQERSVLYMPYMHSESLPIHEVGLTLFIKNGIQASVDFEIKHKKIIEIFGRYPHRNKILNRASTPEEIDFLSQPNSFF
jgi:uncharacterized protein (DUF924 family)